MDKDKSKYTPRFKQLLVVALTLIGVAAAPLLAEKAHAHKTAMYAVAPSASSPIQELVAVLSPTENNAAEGTVVFKRLADGKIRVTANVTGLKPNHKHAIHVHEFGDLRAADGTMTGGHYNPEGHDHALPTKHMRHAGDFGNLAANANGVAEFTLVVDNISLIGPHHPVIGRGVIVHADTDDGGQPTGNAGARIAQGVIGIAK